MLHPHETAYKKKKKKLKLKNYILPYKEPKSLICSPMYNTSSNIYLLIRLEHTHHSIYTSALPTYLNCTSIAQIVEHVVKTNYRIFAKSTTLGTGTAAPYVNPRPLLPCHNHTMITSPDMQMTKSPFNATIDKDHGGLYISEPHT
jgi:hypothetical protein